MRKYIDKISGIFVSFGIDAWIHIVVVIVIATIVARLCFWTGANRALAGCIGAFLAFICGFVKESYDNKSTGVFSTSDLLADAVGALLFLIIFS